MDKTLKTGKIVSLTLIQKTDIIFTKEQSKMIETELESLNNISHINVKNLYAYHFISFCTVDKEKNLKIVIYLLVQPQQTTV